MYCGVESISYVLLSGVYKNYILWKSFIWKNIVSKGHHPQNKFISRGKYLWSYHVDYKWYPVGKFGGLCLISCGYILWRYSVYIPCGILFYILRRRNKLEQRMFPVAQWILTFVSRRDRTSWNSRPWVPCPLRFKPVVPRKGTKYIIMTSGWCSLFHPCFGIFSR